MVRQADQRHALGKPELPAKDLRRAGHLVEAAAVEAGGLGGAQQLQALRHFLQHRAGHGAGQGRIIPAGEPGVDVPDIAADAAQRRHHGVDRGPRIFGRVLVAGKALFLVVEDQARAVGLRHLDQRYARIVGAGRPQPGQIHRLAALRVFRGHAQSACRQTPSRADESPRPRTAARRAIARRGIRRHRAADVFGPIRLFGGFNGRASGLRIECLVIASIIIAAAQQCLFHPADKAAPNVRSSRGSEGCADGLSGNFRLHERRELRERLLPAQIAGFDRNHRRQV